VKRSLSGWRLIRLALLALLLLLGACDTDAGNARAVPDKLQRVLAVASGEEGSNVGTSTTPEFEATKPWSLTWTYDCDPGPSRPFAVSFEPASGQHQPGDITENGQHGGGTTNISTTGRWRLRVQSACSWTAEANEPI
jgi:hypothetical protein